MKNIKQTLTEELSKMNYLFGYKKGQVISEQATTIRGKVEADIAKENLGLTWAQVKQSFGTTGQGQQGAIENQSLYRAWQGGWRPGKPVPEQFQTPSYKQAAQAGVVTTTTTILGSTVVTTTTTILGTNTQISGIEQSNPLKDMTPEKLDAKVEELKNQAKEAKRQRKADRKICRQFANAIDSQGIFKRFNKPVADQDMCDVLRYCISKELVENGKGRNFSACDAFPAKVVTTTTTTPPTPAPAPVVTTTTTIVQNRPTAG